jgi:hypothetical protein
VSGMSHQQIIDELEKGNFGIINVMDLDDKIEEDHKIPTLPLDCINLFDPLQLDYYKDNKIIKQTLQYIKQRRLDTAINKPDALYLSLNDKIHKNRLIIPFKDTDGNIIYYQSRKIFDEDTPSYLSKDKGEKSIFGIDKIDNSMCHVFYIEGPLDATFVRNGLGLGGITKGDNLFTNLQKTQNESLILFEKIWVLDSQWIDQTAKEKTLKLIEMGEKVFIWPEYDGKKFKDINAVCMAYEMNEYPTDLIIKNSCKGLAATVKMKMIK